MDLQKFFRITYEDAYGKKYEDIDSITIAEHNDDFYENHSIRKAVLLVRYINFFKNYLTDTLKNLQNPSMNEKEGIYIPSDEKSKPSSFGQASMQRLSTQYEALFKKFMEHFTKEMDASGDTSLESELQNLQTIMAAN